MWVKRLVLLTILVDYFSVAIQVQAIFVNLQICDWLIEMRDDAHAEFFRDGEGV